MNSKLYLAWKPCRKYGSGHWQRGKEKYIEGWLCGDPSEGWVWRRRWREVIVDLKHCPFLIGSRLRKISDKITFLDDFSYAARKFADEHLTLIPHPLMAGSRFAYTFQRMKVYIYTGGVDPNGVALRTIRRLQEWGDLFAIHVQLGHSFNPKYIERLRATGVILEHSADLDKWDLSTFDLIYMTWGLHYLKHCKAYKIIPLWHDDYSRKLVRYFLGVE
jgi:hypothetical protein